MNDDDLIRYSRHILMPEIDIVGQMNINNSRVAIVGLGGLGAIVARLLVGSGVENIVLIDNDRIEKSNIPRQILYDQSDIGLLKTEVCKNKLLAVNPKANIEIITDDITAIALDRFQDKSKTDAASIDMIIDCTDNLASRMAINAISLALKIPYVYGAANRFEGVVTAFNPSQKYSPCLACWQQQDVAEQNCQQSGILASVVNVIGALQATEVLKILGGFGKSTVGKISLYDAYYSEWQSLKLDKKTNCICADING